MGRLSRPTPKSFTGEPLEHIADLLIKIDVKISSIKDICCVSVSIVWRVGMGHPACVGREVARA